MSRRIDIIANTTAARFRKRPKLLDGLASQCSGETHLHATESLEQLNQVCAEVAHRGSDLVVLAGGDGTFMVGVSSLRRSFGALPLPKLAFLPCGTVATVARNFGMSGDPEQLLRRLLERPDCLRFGPRPSLLVETEADLSDGAIASSQQRVGFIFGTGLVSRFFEKYYDEGARGRMGALGIVCRIFYQSFYGGPLARNVLTPMPCKLTVDGVQLSPRAFSLVCASVVQDLGLHMRVNYLAGVDPHRIHLVASPLSPKQLGPRAHRVLRGLRIADGDHFDGLVSKLEVQFERDTGAQGAFVLDGDMIRASRVVVRAGPVLQMVEPLKS